MSDRPASVFVSDALAGRVALITGGATGICKGIAESYAAHGARVFLVSRKPDALALAAGEIEHATGAEVGWAAADVREADQMSAAVGACIERFGRLDVLVNGAAGNFLSPAAALSPKGFKTVVDIDLLGSFNATRAAFDALVASGRGLILNISATLHYGGTPLQVHAASAKAGVDAMTRTLAVEWGRFGVRVCAIAPGPIGDTEGMRRLAPGEMGKKVVSSVPLGRLGTVRDVAAAAVFLASDAAAWVTGAVLVVDGGQSVAGAGKLLGG